jgi:ParB family transcriptional regulator, chromosome partitioning protein
MFHLNYPIHNLHPAPYNPRFIDDAAFQSLCESIRAFGMLKPIIVAEDGTIVAGHQRLRAVQAMGMTEVPVYVVKDLTKAMEMLFNQLHNGTDLDTGDEHVRVPPSETAGYHDVAPQDITGNLQASGAPVRTEIFKLLISHGPWGGIVANQSGTCLSGAQYAICCKHLGMPCRTYYVPDADTQRVRALFQKSYGQFYYAKLPKTTYAQTFAQPYRCRNDAAGQKSTAKKSSWDLRILPEWQPGERILDFGCGQADYIKKFRRERPDLPIWGGGVLFSQWRPAGHPGHPSNV